MKTVNLIGSMALALATLSLGTVASASEVLEFHGPGHRGGGHGGGRGGYDGGGNAGTNRGNPNCDYDQNWEYSVNTCGGFGELVWDPASGVCFQNTCR